jgi:hypothetical protein
MSTLSRKPPFKIGDQVHVRNTGILGHVYDINESSKTVFVNWVEGPTHKMRKQAFDISRHPETWSIMHVEQASK